MSEEQPAVTDAQVKKADSIFALSVKYFGKSGPVIVLVLAMICAAWYFVIAPSQDDMRAEIQRIDGMLDDCIEESQACDRWIREFVRDKAEEAVITEPIESITPTATLDP